MGWVVLALVFAAALWGWQGAQASSEYLAGCLLERALSLDDIFVFALIFGYFAVPAGDPRVHRRQDAAVDVWHPPIWVSLGSSPWWLAGTILLSLRAEPAPEGAETG